MLGAVDAIKRPLGIPQRFISYMEKHRIYELFHEIATELVIKKPVDHVLYMKQCLQRSAKCRDSPRIILLAPPDFDKGVLAEYLEKKLGIRSVTLNNGELSDDGLTTDKLAEDVRKILQERYFHESGWLFIDFPRNKLEARALQRIGILPTHVIEIVWTDTPDHSSTTDSTTKSSISVNSFYEDHKNSQQLDYNLRIHGLREAYANLLITVKTAGRTFEELGRACVTLSKRQRYSVPCIYRVVLIGARGSGRKCVAKYLSLRYGLIHVDFDYLLAQTRQRSAAVGKNIRNVEDGYGVLPKPDTRIGIIENKLMSHACIKRGWVLTGYPITVEDFKLLDLLATPPNRIVFLHVDEATRRDRLLSRRFNLITGSEHHLPFDNNLQKSSVPELVELPRDHSRSRVEQGIKEYKENIENLLEYAGESVNIVDGMAEKRAVQDRVDACLTRPVICATPRLPKLLEKIKPMDPLKLL